MKKQFWNWVRNEDGTRTLTQNGTIAEESWFEDDVTPRMFRDELNAGTGDVVIWINSPGGDCVAASRRNGLPPNASARRNASAN